MNEEDRVKRPAPERTEPKRHWTEGFAKGGGSPLHDGATDPRDAAYQTINDAYRLIDDYMRQGQQVAENFWLPLGGAAGSFREAPERFMRALGDMTLAWVEVMQQWTATSAGTAPFAATGKAPPFDGVDASGEQKPVDATPSPRSGSSAVRVVVSAESPIELVVDLSEGADLTQLQLPELRDAAGTAAPLSDVSVQRDANGAFVKLVVPKTHPAGTYNGLFLDQTTRRPRGTLSLTLLPKE